MAVWGTSGVCGASARRQQLPQKGLQRGLLLKRRWAAQCIENSGFCKSGFNNERFSKTSCFLYRAAFYNERISPAASAGPCEWREYVRVDAP